MNADEINMPLSFTQRAYSDVTASSLFVLSTSLSIFSERQSVSESKNPQFVKEPKIYSYLWLDERLAKTGSLQVKV